MALDRRTFTSAAAIIAGLGAVGLYLGWQKWVPGSDPAPDGSVDVEALMAPGSLPDRWVGVDDAPVTIVEYASMTCPHCAAFHGGTYQTLKEKHIDTGAARLIFREFPLDDLALFASMLMRCAPEDKFFDMLDVLFEQQRNWATADDQVGELFKIARLAGFTEDSFNACRENEDIARGIREIQERASTDFGVGGTPTFFVNGRLMTRAGIDDFDAIIADLTG
jgi:protein-disulfide isomerase